MDWNRSPMRVFEQPWFLVFGAVSSIVTMIAGVSVTFLVLLGMMVIDVVVGLLRAGLAGDVNSKKAWEGGIRKAIVLAVMGAVYLIQLAIASAASPYFAYTFPDLPTNIPLTEVVASYFILYFLISVLENAAAAGIPLPDILMKVLRIDPLKGSKNSLGEYHVPRITNPVDVSPDTGTGSVSDVEGRPTHHPHRPGGGPQNS